MYMYVFVGASCWEVCLVRLMGIVPVAVVRVCTELPQMGFEPTTTGCLEDLEDWCRTN